jgi:hypothetical protein
LLVFAATSAAQNVLVVTPKPFEPALKKWRAWREAQGFRVTVREPVADPRKLDRKGFQYVLLLGDVKQVPCTYIAADIIRRWERDQRIATDHHVADLDGDHRADLAVGRLPADTPEEAAALLDKVIAYEKNADYSTWRRRINVVAGVGGFGKLQDWAIEQAATRFLSRNVPYSFDLHVTYCNPNSPFCPVPELVSKTALDRFNEGAFFVAYLGHGSKRRLDSMIFNKRRYRIFDEEHAYELAALKGAPMVLLSACSTGHLEAVPDSLAEVMIKQEKGPIVVIASSRVSMPYGNGVIAKELMEALFEDRAPTMGAAFMQSKQRLIELREKDPDRQFIEMLATPYQPDKNRRADERVEHAYLYNLIGDPTMRVTHLKPATIAAKRTAAGIEVSGTSPVAGEALVEMVSERTPNRPKRTGDTNADFEKTYANANARTVVGKKVVLDADGGFKVTLEPPSGAGAHWVRVYVTGKTAAAAASAKVD